ncbi:hypothetical protein CIHG_08581 [Coccidioides immitis H538.4]|uniref:Helicase C-terminal domain-containing protein n=1 Tax=Coccidioides immitis H538.4 TaxID=396776 RepID=A0A0J8S0J7_COCIT|nr:hypothetical protein CIHG_08581 [Coccidioides immitis H538.4]
MSLSANERARFRHETANNARSLKRAMLAELVRLSVISRSLWNPYIEEQAIDRAHRIGQIRPVMVHRILVRDTVEDRILELQEKKRELIENALDERASQNLGRLGTRELAFLFGISSRRQ